MNGKICVSRLSMVGLSSEIVRRDLKSSRWLDAFLILQSLLGYQFLPLDLCCSSVHSILDAIQPENEWQLHAALHEAHESAYQCQRDKHKGELAPNSTRCRNV